MNNSKIFLLIFFILSLFISCNQKKQEKEVSQKKETKLSDEQAYRSKFHFTPESAWMNDPNGLVFSKGTYHLFYQYYPDSTVWGPMHWGHATSKDLLTWKHKAIALFPDSLGYIFSGSAVIDKNNSAGFGKDAMVAIFTYHNPEIEKEGGINFQTQGIAYSVDNGETWDKYKGNAVIANPGIKDFRDPKVFWNIEKNKWQLVLVAQDQVQFYESDNLKEWIKISEFRFKDEPKLGVWECPDLFRLSIDETNEEKWVLIVSHGGGAPNGGSGTRYFVGDYDGTNFTTNQKESLWIDYGTDNYAGVTFNNVDDRRIFIGWMSNWDYATTTPTKEWRSAMTLPRELSLYKKGDEYLVKSKVISELTSLTQKEDVEIEKNDLGEIRFSSKKLQQSVISFEAEIKDQLQIELSNNKGDKYLINYNPETGIFYTDRTKSGIVNFNEKFTQKSKQSIKVENLNKLAIQIILDASSIEIFINNGELVMTNQLFPKENFTNFKILPMKNSMLSDIQIQNIASVL